MIAARNKTIRPLSIGKPGGGGPDIVCGGGGPGSWAAVQTKLININKIEAKIFLLGIIIIV